MKKERNCRDLNLKLYDELDARNEYKDTRYWGLFYCGKDRKLRIDIKRFMKMTGTALTKKQLDIINKRKTHYFYPRKKAWREYNCNLFIRTMIEIEKDWLGDGNHTLACLYGQHIQVEDRNNGKCERNAVDGGFKELIERAVKSVEKPAEQTVGQDYFYQCGIMDYEEAEMNVRMSNIFRQNAYLEKCIEFIFSMHAQFFHQMMSKIEAVQVEVLRNNNVNVKHFNRDVLKGMGTAKNVDIEKLENYKFLDLGYCVWNFLKHNSPSTHQKLREKFPEYLLSGDYKAGYLAYTYINFGKEKLIEKVYTGCALFFIELCKVIWDEDEEQAQWNYNEYFEKIVFDKIETIDNPLGLPPWI